MPTALAPAILRELADQRPHRSACRRDDDRFAGLGLADHAQAAVGGEAGHPQHAEPRRHRGDGRVELAQVGAVRQRVCAPPGLGQHDVAFRVAGVVRGDHRGNGFAGHDAAERDRRLVRLAVVHPAAHVGIERQILHPQQNLPGTWRRDRGLLQAEVGEPGLPLRSGGKDDLAGLGCGHVWCLH